MEFNYRISFGYLKYGTSHFLSTILGTILWEKLYTKMVKHSDLQFNYVRGPRYSDDTSAEQ